MSIHNSRNNNFALLHTFAAFMVILGHMFELLRLPAPMVLNSGIHGVGVNILFVISGYLVTKSFMRDPSVGKYLIKRISRIYPPLIVCVVICAVTAGFFSTYDWEIYQYGARQYIVDNLLMKPRFDLPGIFENNPYPVSVNGSLWTLPLELMLFIILPVIASLLNLCKKCTWQGDKYCAFGFAVLISIIAIYVDLYMSECYYVFWANDWLRIIRLAAYFMWGIAFSTLSAEEIKTLCRGDVAVLLLGIILCMGDYYLPIYSYFILPYIVISFAFSGKGIFRDFFNGHDYAYGLYLWGFPVQQTLISCLYLRYEVSVWGYLGLTIVITTILAIVTNKLVEEPVQKLMSVFLKWIESRKINR